MPVVDRFTEVAARVTAGGRSARGRLAAGPDAEPKNRSYTPGRKESHPRSLGSGRATKKTVPHFFPAIRPILEHLTQLPYNIKWYGNANTLCGLCRLNTVTFSRVPGHKGFEANDKSGSVAIKKWSRLQL